MGFSLWWLLLFQSTGSRVWGLQQLWHVCSIVAASGLQSTVSIVEAHWLSCSAECGIVPGQESNLCLLHWQVDSSLLSPPGKPLSFIIKVRGGKNVREGKCELGENHVFSEMKIPWSFFVKTLLSVKFFLSFFLFLMPSLLLEFSFRNFCAIFPEFYMRYIFISSNSQQQSVSSTE